MDTASSDDDLEITQVVRRELDADRRPKSELPSLSWIPDILSWKIADQPPQRPLR